MAQIQIDVKGVASGIVTCNLYTGNRCIKVYMNEYDYKDLIRDGFFIRDGKEKDSANVLNTTLVYHPQAQEGQQS